MYPHFPLNEIEVGFHFSGPAEISYVIPPRPGVCNKELISGRTLVSDSESAVPLVLKNENYDQKRVGF